MTWQSDPTIRALAAEHDRQAIELSILSGTFDSAVQRRAQALGLLSRAPASPPHFFKNLDDIEAAIEVGRFDAAVRRRLTAARLQ